MSISTSISSIKSFSVCLDGWSYYNFICYNFNIETGYTWSACQSQCNSFRASMLCIPDSTTNTWIANQLLELEYSYSWIGYSDLQLFPDGEDGYGNISSSFPVTSTNQEFPVTSSNQEYGNISSTFPLASSNQGFHVTSSNQEYGHSYMYPTFPVASSNQGFPVTSSNQGFPVTNSNQGFPVTSSNQGFPVNSSNQGFPVTNSNQGYGNNATPYHVTNNDEENGYGNIETIRFE